MVSHSQIWLYGNIAYLVDLVLFKKATQRAKEINPLLLLLLQDRESKKHNQEIAGYPAAHVIEDR